MYTLQRDLSNELALRTKAERSKQDEVRTGSGKRKSTATTPTPLISQAGSKSNSRVRKQSQRSSTTPPGLMSNRGSNKKEKLYCVCRTPYDDTKYAIIFFFCLFLFFFNLYSNICIYILLLLFLLGSA